jgi:hypothetical protein
MSMYYSLLYYFVMAKRHQIREYQWLTQDSKNGFASFFNHEHLICTGEETTQLLQSTSILQHMLILTISM